MIDIEKAKELWPETCHGRWMSEEYVPGLVSVIIPTYNRASLVTEAMDSVWAQTYRPIELIVVDDGSADNTPVVIEQWGKAHAADEQFELRYFRQENRGAPAARNLGLIESRGEFIQYLDSDDLLRQAKVANHVSALMSQVDVDFVYSSSCGFTRMPRASDVPTAGFPVDEPLLAFLRGLPWHTESGLYRRGICRAVGPWNNDLWCCQEWEYHCRLCHATRGILFARGVLADYRVNGQDRISGQVCSPTYARNAARALASVVEQLDLRAVRCRHTRDALARAHFNVARRAAWAGEQRLCEALMSAGQQFAEQPGTRLLLSSFRLSTRLLGHKASGSALEHLLNVTYPIRLAWRQKRYSSA